MNLLTYCLPYMIFISRWLFASQGGGCGGRVGVCFFGYGGGLVICQVAAVAVAAPVT